MITYKKYNNKHLPNRFFIEKIKPAYFFTVSKNYTGHEIFIGFFKIRLRLFIGKEQDQ